MFIKKLLEPNPSRRYTADRALKHPWITRRIYDNIPKTHLEMWKIRGLKLKLIEFFGGVLLLNHFRKNYFKKNQNNQNNPNDIFLNSKTKLNEYQQKVDKQSNIKKVNFLKDREKCLEIEITDNDCFNTYENNNNLNTPVEAKNSSGLFLSHVNYNVCPSPKNISCPGDLNSLCVSPKVVNRGNMIKTNFKIKLVKDENDKLSRSIFFTNF